MPDQLPVHVNRDKLHDVAVPDSFETTGSFDIRLINHGEPLHVHLHLDDALSSIANLDVTNHYVEREKERLASVSVPEGATGRGTLKVASAYGAQTRYVDIVIHEPPEETQSVQVDESLAEPQTHTDEGEEGLLATYPRLPVFVLAAGAALVAIAIALAVKQFVVAAGAVVVLAGVMGAAYMLFAT